MSAQSSKWREEQILILCPGSRTTMAQLGCHELTPPAYRIPTRMFRDEDSDEWRPYRTWKRRKTTAAAEDNGTATDEDEWEYVEDPDSDEGAVHPMEGGYITNMEAFLAFLEHVHGLLTTTYHNTPIVLMASPQWTRPDCEAIALYIFEKTRTPALCMINSALATQYGLKWPHMTVVDIGFEKVDVTCIYDSRIVSHMDIGHPAEPGEDRVISGGEVFTQRLMELLRKKDFTYEMAEQLKKSAICEVLPYAPECPQLMDLPEDEPGAAPVVAAAVTMEPVLGGDPSLAVAADVDADLAMEDGAVAADNDGVLDVAAIVTTGQTKEFLAKKEKEKTERGRFGRRAKEKEAEAAKPVRLPNAKRARTVFHFEELIEDDEPPQQQVSDGVGGSSGAAGTGASTNGKGRDEDAEGSEDGSDAEGSEMDEDEDEDGSGDGSGDGEGEEGGEVAAPATVAEASEKTTAAEAAAEAETKAETKAPAAAATGEDATMTDMVAAPQAETKAATASIQEPEEVKETTETTETSAAATAATAAAAAAPSTDVVAAPLAQSAAAMAAVAAEQQGRRFKRLRRDLEIGLERFTFADRTEIDRIVATIYRTVQGIQDMYMRPSCWENLVFVGNGCRLRGLRENVLQTLQSRHLISPSTATIFSSELPSHLGTPTGTGAQTPTGSGFLAPGLVSSNAVNPLLQAATTASLGGPGSAAGLDGSAHSHHFHAQTPTAIKTAALPAYLGEWTKNGFEEAMFLGAQVAARLAFCVHNLDAQGLESQRLMYLGRIDYNELGPKGIRTHSLLG